MPLLVINERVGSDLAALARLPSKEYVGEFCRQALESLGSGAKKANLRQAAQLLSLELDVVSGAIMALSLLFVEAAKVRALGIQSPCSAPGAPARSRTQAHPLTPHHTTAGSATALRQTWP
jgi:hypothetical protein